MDHGESGGFTDLIEISRESQKVKVLKRIQKALAENLNGCDL
jgi:hypothetical protein